MVLLKMKQTAVSYLGATVSQAAVAVPAHFNDSQREAIRDAVAISGMDLLRLISDTSATALTYNLYNNVHEARNVLIFDLGGGTCDVSLFTIEEGIVEAKATAGDPHLGGEDFDDVLINFFIKEFKSNSEMGAYISLSSCLS